MTVKASKVLTPQQNPEARKFVTVETNQVTGGIKLLTGDRDAMQSPQIYKPKTDYLTTAFSVVDDMSGAATEWNNNRTGCTLSDSTDVVREQNGAANDLVALARSSGYVMARGSTRRDLPTAQGIDNPMRLPSADFGGRTLAQAKALIDSAITYGQTNVFYGHKLVGTATSPASGGTPPVDALEWNHSDYVAFADYLAAKIAAGLVNDITISDLMSNCRH